MKLAVEAHERFEVGGLLHEFDQLGRTCNITRRQFGQVVAQQERLEAFANLVVLRAFGLRQA